MRPQPVRLWIVALAFAAAALLSDTASAGTDPRSIPLVDQSGTVFRIAGLKGRPVVVTFVATRCTDACPIANAVFSRLSTRLAAERSHALLLTITLDPRFDSPFVMARAAKQYGADPRRWKFVSGMERNVRTVMRAFGVVAGAHGSQAPEVHSSFVYVLDGHNRLARTMMLSTNTVDDLTGLLAGKHPLE